MPISTNEAMLNARTWSVANIRPVRYFVRNSRTRLIGFESVSSIDPLSMRSGTMLAVDTSARMVANIDSQIPTPKLEKSVL